MRRQPHDGLVSVRQRSLAERHIRAKFAAYSSSRNNGAPAVGCNSTLGFALPSSSGKAFVDKLWSTAVPSRDYWDGVLYMLGMVHVSGNFKLYY